MKKSLTKSLFGLCWFKRKRKWTLNDFKRNLIIFLVWCKHFDCIETSVSISKFVIFILRAYRAFEPFFFAIWKPTNFPHIHITREWRMLNVFCLGVWMLATLSRRRNFATEKLEAMWTMWEYNAFPNSCFELTLVK